MIDATNRAALVGIRAYAALWIYFGHLVLYPLYNAGFAATEHVGLSVYFIGFHFLAVDFFFVLSGFVLSLKYRDYFEAKRSSNEIDRFFALRLARVYPLHLFFTLIIASFALTGVPHPISSGADAVVFGNWEITGILNLTLMNGWGILPVASWNEPAWTLSIFFLLYILFPNLITAARFLPKGGAANLLLMMGLIVTYGILREVLGLSSHSDGVGAILRGLFFFITGLFIARLYAIGFARNLPWHYFGLALLFICPALIYIWALWHQFPLSILHLFYPLCLGALLYARASWLGLFTHPIAQWLGARSFAIYLLHYPFLLWIKHAFGESLYAFSNQGSGALIACYLGVTAAMLLLSDLCYRLVEMPCYLYVKKRLELS